MEKYSIKVNILNRPYPLLVGAEEEQAVRNAAQMINDKVKILKDKFSVRDDLDAVVMCCLELATDNINSSNYLRKKKEQASDSISRINELISEAILKAEEDVPLKD